ncbi:ribonuclease-3 [Alkalithermobacter thermoalcaliphilus JW-YL-7 = DSM 7308]|uniref:Ribonuclease 3 n=1 Tax=Alkalithermobacter thermoalcaliphilus JW-YL-7 = DSM 7308 TaxID=1121328 RepID=A0A150FSR2_CLOPD|nr:Ribonuclease 3 [[Clostridium] paradoxum JW-YL-7 = DSM 7308]SHL00473.1 ribonuclease-3 [[Clostridium] paradoxum JW-YL-7 = DSM 7308]
MKISIHKLEQQINYTFKNKSYIIEALTHSSYANENKRFNVKHNERLEFLGDSVLGIVISHHLFEDRKELPEGELTKLRANIVCEESLNEVAVSINLGEYLLLGKGEEATGGRERVSILADAFEAVIGAIYLDGGIESAKKFIMDTMKEVIEDSIKGKVFRDYKTHLQEMLQSKESEKIVYEVLKETGPDHNKKFLVQVKQGDQILGTGEGKTKKEAEQRAAKQAIQRIDIV